jgi:bifunctional non-homologous end joining protein LigD
VRAIYPQLAKSCEVTTLEHFINDDKWVMEQKLDGHRLFLMSPGANMPPATMTRNGMPYSKRIPQEVLDFRFPEHDAAGEWVLDGELVGGTFWVFDLPRWPGDTNSNLALFQRRAALETLLGTMKAPFRIVPQAKTKDQKITLAHTALKHGYEGLLLKRADSTYRSAGRTDEWLKLKFVDTADVVVTGVRVDGKESVDYAVWENGDLKPIGRASLIGKEKNGTIAVGDVIEVRYLYVGADGRLYQPTILRKRNDKLPIECTGDQLRHVNKDVLETL